MSSFAERLDAVMEEDDTLTITRYPGQDTDHLKIRFASHHEKFGELSQIEFIDAKKATPAKLIKTIEGLSGRIVNAVETIQGAQEQPIAE